MITSGDFETVLAQGKLRWPKSGIAEHERSATIATEPNPM